MKIFLISIGVILTLILLIYLIGLFLDVKHQASVKQLIKSDRQKIWDCLSDVGSYMTWRRNLKDLQVLSQGERTKWMEDDGHNQITYEFIEKIEGEELKSKIVSENLPFGGTWTFTLNENERGIILGIEENGEVYHPIFRFVSRFIMGHHKSMEQYIDYLKKHLEE